MHEIVYVGGPRHGEREARPGDPFAAPVELRFPTFTPLGRRGEAVYCRREMADTPGAIAYIYDTDAETGQEAR
jgi:hypothetical protein